MSSLQEYWDAIPPITRGYLTGALLMTSLSSFGMVDPMRMLFFPQLVAYKFEIWRLLTNFFFFGQFSFSFVMQMMILGRFGAQVEQDPYRTPTGSTADFGYCVMLMSGSLLLMGYGLNLPALGPSLVFALVYLWSRKNADAPVSVWGFRFTGSSLPWVLLAFTVLTGGSPVPDLCGLVTGHLYYFAVEVLPAKYGRSFVNTPQFMVAIVDQLIGDVMQPTQPPAGQPRAAFGQPQAQQRPAQPARHNWGQGRRLG